MGGFLGLGGASWKTDRKTELQGFSDLHNVFNFALPFAKSATQTGANTTAAGTDAMSSSLGYWQKLLSGNRTTAQQAVAPEANAAMSQSDALKRQQASSGTARGGGVNAVNQQRDTDTMSKVDNALFGARPQAATQVASVGNSLARTGLGEQSIGMDALHTASSTGANITDLARMSRNDSYKINQDMVAKASTAIENALTQIFAT